MEMRWVKKKTGGNFIDLESGDRRSASGDRRNKAEAAELAGYAGNHHQVLKSLKEEVIEIASDVLARSAPSAAFKLMEVLNSDRPVPQANVKLQAAQTILDRVGLGKQDRMEVNHNVGGGIFILPEKQTIDIVAEDGDYEDISPTD